MQTSFSHSHPFLHKIKEGGDTIRIIEYKNLSRTAAQDGEIIDYGIRMCGAPALWDLSRGEGARVGIIDTGVDRFHPDLRGRIGAFMNFSTYDRTDIRDENGHGTHVAGIIAGEENGRGVIGVAPRATLYIAKAFDAEGNGGFNAIRQSLDFLMHHKVDVINMSFSAQKGADEYYQKLREVYREGIPMIAAAGNGRESSMGYPAAYDISIAVNAVDRHMQKAVFNAHSKKPCISAVGTNVYSCAPGGGYQTLSGTSMAAPIITGSVALLQGIAKKRKGRRLFPEEVRRLLFFLSGGGYFSLTRVGKDTLLKMIDKM